MKNSITLLGILVLVTLTSVSCSKENDPSDDNLFVGTYRGNVSYTNTNNNTSISTDEGRVTVIKVGDKYGFNFSHDIPSINSLKMEKNQNILVNAFGTVEIDEGELVITLTEGNEIWGADCSR